MKCSVRVCHQYFKLLPVFSTKVNHSQVLTTDAFPEVQVAGHGGGDWFLIISVVVQGFGAKHVEIVTKYVFFYHQLLCQLYNEIYLLIKTRQFCIVVVFVGGGGGGVFVVVVVIVDGGGVIVVVVVVGGGVVVGEFF